MSIGIQIKKLRTEREMTQEQLADYLGVTSQAISQWECEKSLPDITQIPTLARIFDVTADILLDMDAEREAGEVEEFLQAFRELSRKQEWEKQFKLASDMHQKYPSNFYVMDKYMEVLYMEILDGKEVYREEMYRLCEQIVRDCHIQSLRYRTYGILALLHAQDGNMQKAKEYARQFPEGYYQVQDEILETVYRTRYHVTKSDEDLQKLEKICRENLEHFASDFFSSLYSSLFTLKKQYPIQQKMEVLQKCLCFLDLMYDDNIDGWVARDKGMVLCDMAYLSFEQGLNEQGVRYMREGLKYRKHSQEQYCQNAKITRTCLLFEGVTEDLSEQIVGWDEDIVTWELNHLKRWEGKRELPEEFYEICREYEGG